MAVKIKNLNETEAVNLPQNSWVKLILTGDTVGAKKMCMGYSVFKPGLITDLMIHEEEELAYVVKGRGKLKLEGGKEVAYGPGDGLYIPAGAAHAVVNDGDEDVEMVFGFTWPAYPPTKKL